MEEDITGVDEVAGNQLGENRRSNTMGWEEDREVKSESDKPWFLLFCNPDLPTLIYPPFYWEV